ncbi:hypothetical protein [Rhizobium binae]|uniref:hypothetical protein n=1 Tax=Rhizobium binae TaxID=1138190 RepID=UPI001C833CC4|nr:hypothetical protein [Rhizobium binae]MBX4967839.1 hypothetical protein [Rhizobium binae]
MFLDEDQRRKSNSHAARVYLNRPAVLRQSHKHVCSGAFKTKLEKARMVENALDLASSGPSWRRSPYDSAGVIARAEGNRHEAEAEADSQPAKRTEQGFRQPEDAEKVDYERI